MIPTTTPTKTLIIAQDLRPELIAKIKEVEDELRALPPMKTQADADAVNRIVKKSKNTKAQVKAERMEITRPLNEVIDLIIEKERSATSGMDAMTEVKVKDLTNFAKEQDRLAELEKARIRKEAEETAAKEQARVAGIQATIGAFEKSAYKTVQACTLETIDAKVKGLKSLKFDPKIYQEFMDQVEALRPILLEQLEVKRLELQNLANLAKINAKEAAQEAIAIKERESQALKNIDFKTAENTETAKMNVVMNEQMAVELQESTIQGAKSVMRKWVLKEVLALTDVPYEFLMVDEKKVKEAIKNGRHSIPGLSIEQETINVSR